MGGGDKYCGFYADESIMDFMVNCPIPRLTYFMESMYSRKRTSSRYMRSIKCWSHILTVDETDIISIQNFGCSKVKYISGWVDEKVFRPMPEIKERVEFQFIGFPHIHRQPMIEYLERELGMQNNRYYTLEDYVGGINETRILIGLPSVFNGFTQRVTETLSCGKVLLYPKLPNNFELSKEVFKDRKHILYYNTLEEAVELARFYSANDILRKRIEKQARQEILNKHTIKIRAQQFLDYIHENTI
jgi:spore maturation protein CgeB